LSVGAGVLPVDVSALSDAWTKGPGAGGGPGDPTTDLAQRQAALQQAAMTLNRELLAGLARAGSPFELAYQVGRSLRDTVNPISHHTAELLAAVASAPGAAPAGGAAGAAPAGAPGAAPAGGAAGAAPAGAAGAAPAGAPGAAPAGAPGATAASDAAAATLADVTRQLSRSRVATMQEWLATLGAHFPPDAAAVVRVSLGRWSDLAGVALDNQRRGGLSKPASRAEFAGRMAKALLPQGDVWRDLLVGDRTTEGLLTPEAYVAAGEATLSRTVRIVLRVLWHYWFAVLIIAAALGGILYLAVANLEGAAKVWTSIAAVAGALGVTGRGVATAVGRMATDAERPVFGMEKVDAMAWSITSLPDVRLDPEGVHILRQAGVTKPGRLGRI